MTLGGSFMLYCYLGVQAWRVALMRGPAPRVRQSVSYLIALNSRSFLAAAFHYRRKKEIDDETDFDDD